MQRERKYLHFDNTHIEREHACVAILDYLIETTKYNKSEFDPVNLFHI